MRFEYTQLERDTRAPGVSLHDITEDVRAAVSRAGVRNGTVNVLSRHTTTAVTINEAEPRLMDDVRVFLRKLAPPDAFYLHNDLHVREYSVVEGELLHLVPQCAHGWSPVAPLCPVGHDEPHGSLPCGSS